MSELSTFRINLLRAGYFLIAVGLAITLLPGFINPATTWELKAGVVDAMLVAMSLLALLGLRYPLQLLPLLFFEMGWKAIWLLRVALPLSLSGQLDDVTAETAVACLWAVVFPFVIPWGYVLATYVRKPADPWGRKVGEPKSGLVGGA